ncbi:peptidoglycan -binding protein [Skermanella sp. TT6]|uniref:Peptidoglycan -binding protein n=1 Tax=Skermanella cutis TaxID=2775420 RepID=A0ABX7BBP9_9PROT|nr:peptidoglycan -binding protein [Skermanella sp. TT6]QQP91005.1 peptidoglycan -binding protein [Skermanella sp. TT6]
MAAIGRGRRSAERSVNIWPGWVDALSSLVMVVIFVLMVFIVAQFYLSNTLSSRDQALTRLNRQLSELSDLLSMEREANADLRVNIAQLSAELQSSTATRESLSASLAEAQARQDELGAQVSALSRRGEQASGEITQVSRDLEDAYKVIEADRQKIEASLREIASLQADIQALRDVRERLEGEVAALTTLSRSTEAERDRTAATLEQTEAARARATEELRLTREQREALMAELSAVRDRSQQLEAQLSSEQERTVLAQREIEHRETRIEELVIALDQTQAALTGEQKLTEEGRAEVAVLNQQIAALRDQLARLTASLNLAESQSQEQQAQISDLGRRLNLALASKVEELARYRSEFFGRLREVLGNRQDIRIVGDRFVFQSEVLFPSASATLEEGGKAQLAQLAATLLDIAKRIPPGVNWILRVDGHTDPRPISNVQFPSNWELSTARAISVVKFLVEQGIPSDKLVAAGFGEYQPLDPGRNEDAFARNRRIEMKLDQR